MGKGEWERGYVCFKYTTIFFGFIGAFLKDKGG